MVENLTTAAKNVSVGNAARNGLFAALMASAVTDPDLYALRGKVRAELAAELPTGAARMTVITREGRRETVEVLHPRGSPPNPLTDATLEAKFRQAAPAFADRIERIWAWKNPKTSRR